MNRARQILRGVAIAANLVGTMVYAYFLWKFGLTGGLYDWIEFAEILVPAIAVIALLNSKAT